MDHTVVSITRAARNIEMEISDMDPKVTLALALKGDTQAVKDYNGWIQRGGFAAMVSIDPATDLWMRGVRNAQVRWIGRKYVTLYDETVRGIWTGKFPITHVSTDSVYPTT